jgi:hypothetical protein
MGAWVAISPTEHNELSTQGVSGEWTTGERDNSRVGYGPNQAIREECTDGACATQGSARAKEETSANGSGNLEG